MHDGLSGQAAAYVLSWLEPMVLSRLDDDVCGRGAAVLTRAAADHSELSTIGLSWFEEAVRRRVDPRYIAEAGLNLSVAAAARRKYAEAEWILNQLAPAVAQSPGAASLLAIGHSAWRRRVLSEALVRRRTFYGDVLREVARDSLRYSVAAVELTTSKQDYNLAEWLRAAIRRAEALAVSSALVQAVSSSRVIVITMKTHALRLHDEVTHLLENVDCDQQPTAYDLARVEVIRDVASALETGRAITEFQILHRVRRIQANR